MPDLTRDGCSVELYTLLPAAGEPRIVHAAIEPGATVLDLGAGTGRIAHELLALGHPVVAVDDSADMLAHVRGAETVCARIEDLRLGRRFPAVLLASHLVNTADDRHRRLLLDTAARHLAPGGVLVAEWHPPEWFDRVSDGAGGSLGPVTVRLRDVAREGDLVRATVRYTAGESTWDQPFTSRRLTEPDLHAALAGSGLTFAGWRTPGHTWFTAAPTTGGGQPSL